MTASNEIKEHNQKAKKALQSASLDIEEGQEQRARTNINLAIGHALTGILQILREGIIYVNHEYDEGKKGEMQCLSMDRQQDSETKQT